VRIILSILFLILGVNLYSQCDVIIQPGTLQKIDVNPGVKFSFTIKNNGTTPFQNGTFHLSFGWLDSPMNPQSVWNINLSAPIQPNGTLQITTPVFDIPTPQNATEWPFWDETTGPNGWPNPNYGSLMVYLNGCFINAQTINSFLPLSDDCPNINQDQFCDCNFELYDFRTEPEMQLDVVVHSDYNCFSVGYPPGPNNFNLNNPGFYNMTIGINSLLEDNCGPSPDQGHTYLHFTSSYLPDYVLGDTITLDLDQASNYSLITCLQESYNQGNFDNCYEVVLWQINNSSSLISPNTFEVTVGDNIIRVDENCQTVVDVTDLSIDSFSYDIIGCNVGSPYAAMNITLSNQGNTTITNFCLNLDILPDGIPGEQYCFSNLNILPGQSYVVEVNGGSLSNGVTSISIETPNDVIVTNNTFVTIIDLPCYGCTISSAINYDPFATVDDGSCIMPVPGCMDPLANNYNPNATVDDGSCTYDVFGCTDPLANNFNPDANTDDGSCLYDVFGCTDPSANNYNPNATVDDGSCTYDPILIFGCTDPLANNYDPSANTDDGSCTYDIFGCTDPEANNYNPNANIEDGSCTYDPEIIFGCTDPTALNFDPFANSDDGTCIYEIDICEEADLHTFVPNVITPNNDGLNDVWRVVTQSDCWRTWKTQIYNRWGSLIWESEDPDAVWNASNSGSTYFVSDGIYVYTITGVAWNNKPIQKSGYVTIMR
jgi:gliding motility-associated-like protein